VNCFITFYIYSIIFFEGIELWRDVGIINFILERKIFQFLVVASKVFFEVAATAFQRDGIKQIFKHKFLRFDFILYKQNYNHFLLCLNILD
jgi:hypothetical protein